VVFPFIPQVLVEDVVYVDLHQRVTQSIEQMF
jgi:hypothetical protein